MKDQELLSLHRPKFKLHPSEVDKRTLRLPPVPVAKDKDKEKDKKETRPKGGLRVAFWTLGGRCMIINASKEEIDEISEGTVENFTQSELLVDTP